MNKIIKEGQQIMSEMTPLDELNVATKRLAVFDEWANNEYIKAPEYRIIHGWYVKALEEVTTAFALWKLAQSEE